MSSATPVQIFRTFFITTPRLSAVSPDISHPAEDLREILLQSSDIGDAVYDSLFDLLEFSMMHPEGLDTALRIWSQGLASDQEDDFPVDATAILARFIADHAKLFQGVIGQADIGREVSWDTYDRATGDACNITFTKEELDEKLAHVLERTKSFQESRREIIMLQAIRGRSHATRIVTPPADSIEWIDFSLDPFHEPSPPWSKADFIACCVLLRSCAKSLIEDQPLEAAESKLQEWKTKYSAFIYSDTLPKQPAPLNRDGDFVVKLHAMVSCGACYDSLQDSL